MKDNNVREKRIKTKRMNKEKRFYLWTAVGSAAALIAIVTVAVIASRNPSQEPNHNSGNSIVTPPPSNNNSANTPDPDDNQQVAGTPEAMAMPVESVSLLNDYGFYHNTTLNCYYEHSGLDFAAEVGANVCAVAAGTVESVYKDDLLLGTQIVIDHGDGLKSVYRFVTEVEGLKAGDKVNKG